MEPAGSAATMPRMEASTARRLAHGMWFGTLAMWLGAVTVLATSPSDAISAALLGLPIATYGSVGALVARRNPRHKAERHAPSATVQVHLGSDDEAIRFTICLLYTSDAADE